MRGLVREVDAKGAIVDLGGGIDGYLRASELSRDRVEDARTLLKVGDEVEAKFTAVDRKVRTVALSIKAKDMAEEAGGDAELSLRFDDRHQPRRPAQGADLRPGQLITRGPAAAYSRRGPVATGNELEKIRGSSEWTASAA